MKALLDLAVPAITFLLLLAVGLDLAPADFARVRRQRRVLAAGLVGPLLVLPPLALLLVVLSRPSSDLQAGLLLVAACPIGGISNTYSYLARASTALVGDAHGVLQPLGGRDHSCTCRGLQDSVRPPHGICRAAPADFRAAAC